MARKTVNVAMIGYKFMGKAHSNAWRQVGHFFPDLAAKPVLKVVCGRDAAGTKAAAEQLGWEEVETDWQKAVARKDIDIVDVCTPGDSHAPISIAAAKAGKHVICEKPLANTVAEAKLMLDAVKKAKVKHLVAHNYRRAPAVQLMKKMIDDGRIGTIYHVRAVYLQDWILDPKFPMVWRFDKKVAGSGAHGDLNAHIIDLARMLAGEITSVGGLMETFIKERPLLAATTGGLTAKAAKGMGKVTVDDCALFCARFASGAVGTFEATRFAGGHKNGLQIEINGSKGSMVWSLESLNELKFWTNQDDKDRQGFQTILVTDGHHPYVGAWWPPGHIIGYEHTFTHEVYEFLKAIEENKAASPSFEDGVRNQLVLDAVEKSANEKRWVSVAELS
jgi:predicted dehydrogenase